MRLLTSFPFLCFMGKATRLADRGLPFFSFNGMLMAFGLTSFNVVGNALKILFAFGFPLLLVDESSMI